MRDLILQLSKSSIYSTKPGNGANLLMEGQDQGDLRHDVIRALFPNHYTGI
ncbi:TPA: hypothetical protein MFM13_005176 [Klebsiella pneumoniae]|nr:hypothetical protein [Klebsiella pneumoniae]HBW8421334.1 hypothetical protein [Klebsiella pneumoniae]